MSKHLSWRVYAALSGILLGSSIAYAQLPTPETAGQDVVPVYEGWEQNPDGSFDMFFGYMNRNYVETPNIPVGPNNAFSPGDQDRGQPTFFSPRREEFVFRVRVPKDWGNQDLVWTLTSNGRTEKAYGTLMPVWEIDERLIVKNMGGTQLLDEVDTDKPPTLEVQPIEPVALPGRTQLTVLVSDDGIPKPSPRRAARGGQGNGGSETITNTSLPTKPKPPQGLSVRWIKYRGPGDVKFDPSGYQVADGSKVITSVTFSEPGVYVLRAIASDSIMETTKNVTITVKGSSSKP